jgi:predicted phosphoribosyltransferase
MTVADFLDEAHVDLATMQQVLDTAQRALDVAERAEQAGRRARRLIRRIVLVVAVGLVGAGAVYAVTAVLADRRATPPVASPAGPRQNGTAAPETGTTDSVT